MEYGGGEGGLGDRVFDIEIGKMSKSDMIKYCRDEWIMIPADVMRRLRGKEKTIN